MFARPGPEPRCTLSPWPRAQLSLRCRDCWGGKGEPFLLHGPPEGSWPLEHTVYQAAQGTLGETVGMKGLPVLILANPRLQGIGSQHSPGSLCLRSRREQPHSHCSPSQAEVRGEGFLRLLLKPLTYCALCWAHGQPIGQGAHVLEVRQVRRQDLRETGMRL